ncbi:hypothetical protein Ahy_B06g083837 [Arachis hypogaea]|uniref:Uncharacterized protein n=1 Tax=Arachis hypogaea TaxID=3818 RepID=A0A444YQG8_ARAHY|nr:hypothetical protein Ahy_B06g083837 [Arachis hypogaea]
MLLQVYLSFVCNEPIGKNYIRKSDSATKIDWLSTIFFSSLFSSIVQFVFIYQTIYNNEILVHDMKTLLDFTNLYLCTKIQFAPTLMRFCTPYSFQFAPNKLIKSRYSSNLVFTMINSLTKEQKLEGDKMRFSSSKTIQDWKVDRQLFLVLAKAYNTTTSKLEKLL